MSPLGGWDMSGYDVSLTKLHGCGECEMFAFLPDKQTSKQKGQSTVMGGLRWPRAGTRILNDPIPLMLGLSISSWVACSFHSISVFEGQCQYNLCSLCTTTHHHNADQSGR